MDTLDRIVDLIDGLDIEYKEFSKSLGLAPQAITDWKAGKSKSYNQHLAQIAKYFNVSADYLLGLSSQRQPVPEPLLIVRFNALTQLQRQTILYQIDTFERQNKLNDVVLSLNSQVNKVAKSGDNTTMHVSDELLKTLNELSEDK